AAFLFKAAGERARSGTPALPTLPSDGFGIGEEQLTKMTRDHDFSSLQEYGGVGSSFRSVPPNMGGMYRSDRIPIRGPSATGWALKKVGMTVEVLHLLLFWLLWSQIPADGVVITGHSLAIDESSMTGESKIVSFSLSFC
ncbi:hypothetical protein B296_00042718, partial [Ensete ventricosum]